uniref:Hydrogenase n=1 Tax=Geobacter metallireducens TaxID=28232 RepID=A0A831XFL9_GEOME
MVDTVIHILITLLLPPLLLGVINRTKALFAGRTGPPLLQAYYDLAKLVRKGSVFSATTTSVFRAGPVVALAATFTASLLIPLGEHRPPLSFGGDMILFAYLFGLARFCTTAAALDTGSSFEGMGAAREATYACLAEPALFFSLAVLARLSGSLSLTPMLTGTAATSWLSSGASLLLLAGSLFIVLLAENCRVPFDDPNTHLELTMIHEVMVLDHSGPLFGAILYGAAMKLFVLGALFTDIALPYATGIPLADWVLFVIAMLMLAVGIGVVESVMARLRLTKIPQMLAASCILAAFSLLLVLR